MTGRRPSWFARWLIERAADLLTLDDRVRYREEFRAELADVGRRRQLRYAVSVLLGTLALRRALAGERGVVTAPDWRCGLHWHRFVGRPDPTARSVQRSQAVHHLVCGRCGRFSTVAVRRRNLVLAALVVIPAAFLIPNGVVAALVVMSAVFIVANSFEVDVLATTVRGPGHQFRDDSRRGR